LALPASPQFGTGRDSFLLPLVVALLAYAIVVAAGPRILDDPDTYSHVTIGQWIIAHAAIPHRDVFSFSMRGEPWVPDEWLSEVVLAWVYGHLGWEGMVLTTALLFAAAMALLARALQRTLDPPYVLIAVVACWGLCFPHLTARPHVFTLPLLVIWTDALVMARAADRAPSPWLVVVMALWANLHGGFILGLGLAALFAGEAIYDAVDARAVWRAARGWGIFLVLATLAACATPNGIAELLLPFQLIRMKFAMSLMDEWQSPNFQQLEPLEFWLLLALLGILALGLRLTLTRIIMLLVLLHMAFLHKRFGENVGLIVPLLVAPMLATQLPRLSFAALGRKLPSFERNLAGPLSVTLAGAIAVVVTLAALRIGVTHDNGRFAPASALATVAQRQVAGPVFNDLKFGSYLIFSNIAPFVDGRVDMYGDPFLKRYETVGELPGLLEQYKITWTLLEPSNPRVAVLDQMSEWRRLYADDIAVVHVRDGAVAIP
jgi:hypothetical protein